MADEELMTASEVAEYLGLTPETVKSYTTRGKIRSAKKDLYSGKRGRPARLYWRRDIEQYKAMRELRAEDGRDTRAYVGAPFTRYRVTTELARLDSSGFWYIGLHQEDVDLHFRGNLGQSERNDFMQTLSRYMQVGWNVWMRTRPIQAEVIGVDEIAFDHTSVVEYALAIQAQRQQETTT